MNHCAKKLIAWYDDHHRQLPWRETRNIYHTWVCEVMSQQTTLAAVIPKFSDFVKHIPTVHDLAAGDEEKLRKLWSGLGYYARARNLKKGAQFIVEQRDGHFPQSYREWLEIPGCGPYTAAVIASISFNEKVACVDGNVVRVVSRLLALSKDVWSSSGQSAIRASVDCMIPDERPGDFNQAMMELGATISLPATAQVAYQQGRAIAQNIIAQSRKHRLKPCHVTLRGTLMKLGLHTGVANLFDKYQIVGRRGHRIRHLTYLELLPTPLHDIVVTREWIREEIFHLHTDVE